MEQEPEIDHSLDSTGSPKAALERSSLKPEREMHPEIAELKEPMQKLLEQLRGRIDRGEYQLIIGDDASGRIPARIMHWVLQEVYKEKGLEGPDMLFFAGSGGSSGYLSQREGHDKADRIAAFIDKFKRGLPTYEGAPEIESFKTKELRKVLVVTETILTGGSLVPTLEALKKHNIEYEIATIGLVGAEHGINNGENKRISEHLGGKIYYGQDDAPEIEFAKQLSGVSKNIHEIHSRPRKNSSVRHFETEAREDAKKIADELVRWYHASQIQNAKVKSQNENAKF